MGEILQDLRFAWRQLRATPGFALLATLTLALGIGANTAVYSVLDPLLIRTLPVHEPGRLVAIRSVGTLGTNDIWWPEAFDAFAAADGVLSGVAGLVGPSPGTIVHRNASAPALVTTVSANYFEVLGVPPHVGRVLTAADDADGIAAAVLAHGFWAREFGGDQGVVGQTVQVNNRPYVIVGVAPRGFSGTAVGSEPDMFISSGSGRRVGWVGNVARLAPGVSADQAQDALAPLLPRLLETSGLVEASWPQLLERLVIVPAARGTSALRDRAGQTTWLLMGIVALVLLIACINVANLGLTRAAGRQVATGIQLALGAPRRRLARQVLFETGLITVAGAGAGVLVAGWAGTALVSVLVAGEPNASLATGLDLRVAAFTVGIMAVTVLLSGLWPAFATSRVDVLHAIKPGSAGQAGTGRPSALRNGLLIGQVALSVVLLTGAGMLIRTVVNLSTHDLGFDDRHVLAVSLTDSVSGRPAGQASQVLARIVERVSGLPGVDSVSFNSLVPLTRNEIGITVGAEDAAFPATSHTFFTYVAPAYFETMGMRIVSGRDFPAAVVAGAPVQVIINQTLGRRLFGGASPIGHFVRFLEGPRPPMEIVGVASDAVYNAVREEQRSFMYVRSPSAMPSIRTTLVVRLADLRAAATIGAVEASIGAIDPGVRVTTARTIRDYVNDSLHRDRLIAGLASGFSVLALGIAAVGLFGVLAVAVAGQTREIGVRMALGADARRIARFVAGPAVSLVSAGLLLGLLGAALMTPVVSSLLFGIETVDVMTVAAVAATLAAEAGVACYVPARRAVRIDPASVLRGE